MATPTITPIGYDPEQDGTGTIAPNHKWAQVSGWLGGHWYTIPDPDALRVTAKGGGTRQVDITGGYAGAVGVMNEVGDGSTSVAGDLTIADDDPSVATWYMVCLHYAFGTTQATSFKVITAGVKDDVPARDTLKFGPNQDVSGEDQPLALVQLTPGQAAPTRVIDLRLIGSNAVYLANDKRVLSYAGWPGVLIRIGTSTWVRTANEWVEIPGPFGVQDLSSMVTGGDLGVARNEFREVATQRMIQVGNRTEIDIFLRRSGADIEASPTGNFPDTLMYTLYAKAAAGIRPGPSMPVTVLYKSHGNTMTGGAYLTAEGDLWLSTGMPGANLTKQPDGDWSVSAHIEFTREK